MAKLAASLAAALGAQEGAGRRAAALSLLSPLIWLVQAALLAQGIAAILQGQLVAFAAVLAPYAAGFLALGALRVLADGAAMAAVQRLSARLRAGLRAGLIGHVLRLSPNAQNDDHGQLASLMGEGIAQIGPWVERYRPAMWRAKVLPLVILALVLWQSWAAALALVLTGPLIPVFMALVGWAAEAASRRHLVQQGALNGLLIDRMAALIDLRLLGAGDTAGDDLARTALALREDTMKVLRLAFMSSAVLEFFAALGVAMVALYVGLSLLDLIAWGAWGGGAAGAGLTPFGGIFILLIAPDFYQPLRDLASAWHDRAAAEAAGGAIDGYLAKPDVILGQGLAMSRADLPKGAALWWQDLTLTRAAVTVVVPAGQVTAGASAALVGASGVGKTSALMALTGLVAAQGRIGIGAQALDDRSADALRAHISVIPQNPRFPEQPLGDWLAGGGPAPSPEALWQALERAQIAPVVRALPAGLDTILGETGGGVSGGEARRLMIARALLQGRPFVLADEPTADLDNWAAGQVTDALMALTSAGAGLLVATHDPALIARCGTVIALEHRAQGDA